MQNYNYVFKYKCKLNRTTHVSIQNIFQFQREQILFEQMNNINIVISKISIPHH